MKKLFYLVAIVCIVAAVSLGTALALSTPFLKTSDTFFRAVAEKRFDDAYALTSTGYRETHDKDGFWRLFDTEIFASYSGARWKQRKVTLRWPPEGVMEGTVFFGDIGLPAEMEFLLEEGHWHIESVEVSSAQ